MGSIPQTEARTQLQEWKDPGLQDFIGYRDFTPPALAFPVGAVSHGLVAIRLPVPLLGSVHEGLTLASGVPGSVSLMLAFQALKMALSPRLPSPEGQSQDTYFSTGARPNYWPLGSKITLASPSLP